MSNRNVELTRRLVDAFNARDIDAMILYCDPSIEFDSAFGRAIGGDVIRGHDGLRRWHRDYNDVWGEELRLRPEAYFNVGDHTLTLFTMHGRGQYSGAEVATPIAVVARWQDGLCVYLKGYLEREGALSDLGVTEGELEPIAP